MSTAGGTILASSFTTYGPTGLATTTCFAAQACATATNAGDRHTDLTYDAVGRALTARVYDITTLRLSTTTTYLGDGAVAQVAFDGTGSVPSEGARHPRLHV